MKIDSNLYQILSLSPVPMCITSFETGEFVAINKKFEEWTGYNADEVIGKLSTEITLYYSPNRRINIVEELAKSGNVENLELWLIKKDGIKICSLFNAMVVESSGKRYIVSTGSDLSGKIDIENKLIESEKKFRELFMNASDAVYLWHLDKHLKIDKLLETNEAACKMTGYSREELFGMLPWNLLTGELREDIDSAINSIIEEKFKRFESRHRTKSGNIINVDIRSRAFRLNDEQVIMSLVSDVTSSKKLEEQLLLTQFCVDETSVGVMRTDNSGKIVSVNKYICNMLDYTYEELTQKFVYEIDPNYSYENWINHRSTLKEHKTDTFETRHISKSGTEIPVEVTNTYIVYDGTEYSFSFVRNISESKKIKEDLLRTQFVVDNATDAIYWFDKNWNVVYANSAACNILEYNREELLSKSIYDIDPDISVADITDMNKFIMQIDSTKINSHHKTKTGKIFPVEISVNLMNFHGEEFTCLFVRDITERIESEKIINENEHLLVESQKIAKLGHFIFDVKTNTWKNSPLLNEIFGIDDKYERNYEGWINLIHPDHRQYMLERFDYRKMNGIEPFEYEYKLIRNNDRQVRWVQGSGRLEYDKNDNLISVLGTVQDITERKLIEEQIKSSLEEKEILIKEIHHRVKNNLQVVSSLLYLQSIQVEDEEIAELFKLSQNRVKSMALIHEKLYQSSDLVEIDFTEYINSLVSALKESYVINSENVVFEIDANGIALEINQSIACGLILNELITNSLKHAFTNKDNGKIKIKLSKQPNNYILDVIDDGIGLKKEIHVDNLDSLGVKIVANLVRQINGELLIKSDNGTNIRITFPVTN